MKKTIGTNVSSGAEKVERVEETKETATGKASPKSTKSTKNTKDTKSTRQKSAKRETASSKKRTARAKKQEEAAADRRVEAAKLRMQKKQEKAEKAAAQKSAKRERKAELKAKKSEKRQAVAQRKRARQEAEARRKQERLEKRKEKRAERKEKRIEKHAERIARKEMLRHESKAEKRQRLAREKKEKRAAHARRTEAKERAREEAREKRERAHSRRAEAKKRRREARSERRRHAPGFGGWLAAVISLGTACLVLATVVTAGALRMNDMQVASENGYRSTLFEMVSVSEELDDNLGKLRISAGADEQRQLLTDILVGTSLMESTLEKIPVDAQTGIEISAFVNRTGAYARMLLSRISAGGTLTAKEKETVAELYAINGKLCGELNELISTMTAKDFTEFLTGKGAMQERFGEIAGGTKKQPEETDSPFLGEGNVGKNRLEEKAEISSSEAEERARQYFASYHIRDVRYTGETVAEDFSCYNFLLTDEGGLEIYAQIAKSGELAFFDTYEECNTKNFDLASCDAIAREYLKGIGIEGVEAVWLSDGGMVANLTYTTVQDGVRIYPEILLVRVCEEKGRVVGMDARGYLLNHTERSFSASISEEEARRLLSEGLEPYAVHLAVIPVNGEERLAYELACNYGEEEFIVYLDAHTGAEVRIFRVKIGARGSYLR